MSTSGGEVSGGMDLDALLGSGAAPFPKAKSAKFEPWHRPRKQYVRYNQWYAEVDYLARDVGVNDGELRYLTLPGDDFLDVRLFLTSLCEKRNLQLRYLGFNTAAQPMAEGQLELDSAQFSIKRMAHVNPQSSVIQSDVREVGDKRSMSWHSMRDAGPYHVINLDLCTAIAGPHTNTSIPNYFSALQNMLEYQAAEQQAFVLLITTRMDAGSVAEDAKAKLDHAVLSIHGGNDLYASSYAECWDLTSVEPPLSVLSAVLSHEAFMLGVAQWIVYRGIDVGLKASVKSFMTYRTGDDRAGEDELVSFAIRFDPDPVVHHDPFHLAEPPASQVNAIEKVGLQSRLIPKRVKQRILVDQVLGSDDALLEVCIAASSTLLESAGYDVSQYREWVSGRRSA